MSCSEPPPRRRPRRRPRHSWRRRRDTTACHLTHKNRSGQGTTDEDRCRQGTKGEDRSGQRRIGETGEARRGQGEDTGEQEGGGGQVRVGDDTKKPSGSARKSDARDGTEAKLTGVDSHAAHDVVAGVAHEPVLARGRRPDACNAAEHRLCAGTIGVLQRRRRARRAACNGRHGTCNNTDIHVHAMTAQGSFTD